MITTLVWLACVGNPEPADKEDTAETGSPDTETGPHTAETGETGETGETEDSPDSPPDTETDSPPDTGPFDRDSDGYDETMDCDDANPWTYPGAEEWCDPFDHDCDGENLAPGVCGKVQEARAVGVLVGFTALFLTADMSGDGTSDFFWYAGTAGADLPLPNGGSGYAFGFQAGGSRDRLPLTGAESGDYFVTQGPYGCSYDHSEVRVIGDADGDGFNDAAWISQECYQGIFVTPGPFPTDGSAAWTEDTEFAWYVDSSDIYAWVYDDAWGGDLDGDGLGDYLAEPGDAAFDVFFGGTWGRVPVQPIARDGGVSAGLRILEDLDGDGLSDMSTLVEAVDDDGYGHHLISGLELRSADGAMVDDLRFAYLNAQNTEPVGTLTWEDTLSTIGDLTGDGYSELVVTAPDSESLGYEHGEVFVLEGPVGGDLLLEDALGSWVGPAKGTELYLRDSSDVDGDGFQEVSMTTASRTYILRATLPAPRTPVSGLALDSTYDGFLRPGSFDFDNDGFADLSGYFNEADGNGNAYLIPGWPIPWDDATYW